MKFNQSLIKEILGKNHITTQGLDELLNIDTVTKLDITLSCMNLSYSSVTYILHLQISLLDEFTLHFFLLIAALGASHP